MLSDLKRTGVAGAMLAAAVALPAAGAEPYGYWAVNTAPDGIKLGVIFPEFSPNDFAGLMFLCTPGTSTVMISVDSAKPMRKGARASITITADAERTVLNGKAELSEMDDQTRVIVHSTMSDPVIAALAGAQRISFGVGNDMRPLPTKGARAAVGDFLAKCGASQSGE